MSPLGWFLLGVIAAFLIFVAVGAILAHGAEYAEVSS